MRECPATCVWAVFATAAGALVAAPDAERFHAIWDAGLFIFGGHLMLVGIAIVRISNTPTSIGVLVLIAGLGYLIDAVSIALNPATSIRIGEFAFVFAALSASSELVAPVIESLGLHAPGGTNIRELADPQFIGQWWILALAVASSVFN